MLNLVLRFLMLCLWWTEERKYIGTFTSLRPRESNINECNIFGSLTSFLTPFISHRIVQFVESIWNFSALICTIQSIAIFSGNICFKRTNENKHNSYLSPTEKLASNERLSARYNRYSMLVIEQTMVHQKPIKGPFSSTFYFWHTRLCKVITCNVSRSSLVQSILYSKIPLAWEIS